MKNYKFVRSMIRSILSEATGQMCDPYAQGQAWIAPYGYVFKLPPNIGHGTWVADMLVYTNGILHSKINVLITDPQLSSQLATAFDYYSKDRKTLRLQEEILQQLQSPKFRDGGELRSKIVENAQENMFGTGWIRVANAWNITIGNSTPPKAWDGWLKIVQGCIRQGEDIESKLVNIDTIYGPSESLPMLDVIEKNCSREAVDKFWESISK